MSTLTNPDVPKDRPAFIPLEANPELMTKLIHKLGVSEALQIHDVYSLTDPDLLAFIPRPALALLLVFPVSATYESHRMAEDGQTEPYRGKGEGEPVIWWRQTIRNACGLMGILHAVSNGPARSFIQEGSTIDDIIKKSIPLTGAERSKVLEESHGLATAHFEAASVGDTPAPPAGDDIDLHYVCFVKGNDGALWELDGRRQGPIRRGELNNDEDVLSEKGLNLGVLKFLEREGGDLRFSAVALAGTRIGIARWLLGKRPGHTGVLLGNDSAGKTTLLYRLKLGETVQAIPTIGFNIETIEFADGGSLTLWDVGGCDQMRPLIRHYIVKERFLVFLHDCSDAERLEDSIEQLRMALRWMSELGCRHMWILLNKQDLLPASERQSIVDGIRSRFESEVSTYRDNHRIMVVDLPGLSAASGAQLDVVVKEIRDTLKQTSQKTTYAQVEEPERATDEKDLVERVKQANAQADDPDHFWESFVQGDLESWDHYAHLRAGYFVLFEGLSKGSSLLDCAGDFLGRLKELRQKNPSKFRNTAHRTMTIFWLYQIQLAAVAYKAENRLETFPSRADFGQMMLLTPSLMDAGLWKAYYSKDLMFSSSARENWHLPDLQPLTPFRGKKAGAELSTTTPELDHYKLPRFAFSVVQKTLSSKLRRGGVVKQALAALQSSTIRLRASDASVPPYSETQAYFWIQLVHASLRSLDVTQSPPAFDGPATALSFEAFRTLFDVTGAEWRRYYSQDLWEDVSSRMSFVNPDLKPLPNVFASPSRAKVDLARLRMANAVTHRFAAPAELPPREELDFNAAIVVDEADLMPAGSLNVGIHASLLQYLHRRLSTEKGGPSAKAAAKAALDLSETLGATQSMFWVQQAQLCMAVSGSVTFEEFVTRNPHLAYEDLPLSYYSPELWWSSEAKGVFVPPDRRPVSSIVSPLASR
ncbi:hypothetical protein B0J13DRAFT_641189 [Dactylonectria estremocensis]|uniref:Ubiquitin carboxyl-terminal hydrolase n=1 Tax=Dactylonectria estremocensis TaxID=1079267 RepID=A0A9P9IXW6_9HYPO|nr:hypothetical protein B0J13DRAFT_641189 [Dactylonectria estremocensis]